MILISFLEDSYEAESNNRLPAVQGKSGERFGEGVDLASGQGAKKTTNPWGQPQESFKKVDHMDKLPDFLKPVWPSEEPIAFSLNSALTLFSQVNAPYLYVVNKDTMTIRMVLNTIQAREFYETGDVLSY